MAPRACVLLLGFASALLGCRASEATDDSVCMLQNTATASGEVASNEVNEATPFDPFWWLAKHKSAPAKQQPAKEVKAKQWPAKGPTVKLWPAKEAQAKAVEPEPAMATMLDAPAVTATPPPKKAPEAAPIAPQMPAAAAKETIEIPAEPEMPEMPEVPADAEEPEVAQSEVPHSVSTGVPLKARKWHFERKYGADYPGGPTLAVRQRLQKERLAAKQERKEELKFKWHQRQVAEKREADLKKRRKEAHEEYRGLSDAELQLRAKEAHERREARKLEVDTFEREKVKAEKKRLNQKRKVEYQAHAEQVHWENEAKLRKAARATKAKMLKESRQEQEKSHAEETHAKMSRAEAMVEKEQKRIDHREEILERKYGHEVKPVLQHGVVLLKVWSPFQAHSIDAKVPAQARLEVLTKVAATRLGVAPEKAILKWGHRRLSGDVTVAAYGLKDGDQLQLEQIAQ